MQVSTLKPGLLVSLKTSIVGNVAYQRVSLEEDHVTDEGTRRARWETKRVITNPKERALASFTRSQCRAAVARVCSNSTFGLLCPEDRQADLDAAIKKAQAAAAEFNSVATLTRVHVYVIAGRIAADDIEAARAINSEVRGLLTEMEEGIKRLDVSAVRQAANKAKSIGRMLSPAAAERIKVSVEAAREVARKIVKAGEEAGVAIDHAVVRRIAEARTAFLDLDEVETQVVAPVVTARAVDLEPPLPLDAPAAPKRRRGGSQQPQLEM